MACLNYLELLTLCHIILEWMEFIFCEHVLYVDIIGHTLEFAVCLYFALIQWLLQSLAFPNSIDILTPTKIGVVLRSERVEKKFNELS